MENGKLLVGVIMPHWHSFEKYTAGLRQNSPECKFVKISKIDDVRGRAFDELLDGVDYWKVDPKVIRAAKLRVVNHHQKRANNAVE